MQDIYSQFWGKIKHVSCNCEIQTCNWEKKFRICEFVEKNEFARCKSTILRKKAELWDVNSKFEEIKL